MSEISETVYGIVNRAFSGFDPHRIIEDSTKTWDISFYASRVSAVIEIAANEYNRPSVMMRPKVYIDGDQWCAVYGDTLQDGVAGFGKSPALAMYDFDEQWNRKLP